MRRAVRAIIIHDDRLLIMRRNKFGQVYVTLPGGGVDGDEQLEEALARELMEETTMAVSSMRLVFVERAGEPWGDQYIYYCEYAGGDPRLSANSGEAYLNNLGHNLYVPDWLPLTEFELSPFRSEKLQQAILAGIREGWPSSPVELAG